MKKFLVLLTLISTLSTTTVFAADKTYNIYINNNKIQTDTSVELYRNSTFVPISFVAKELGATSAWNSPNVTITKPGLNLILTVGSNAYTKNSETFYTQNQPYISNGRTYVPLRLVSNAFGYPVDFKTIYNSDNTKVEEYKINIDTTRTVAPSNAFVDDNSTFTLSPNKKYGYKTETVQYTYATGGGNQAKVTYFKNMETGEFKELDFTTRHHHAYWTSDNRLVLGSEKNTTSLNSTPYFTMYDPATDTLTHLADAYFGLYLNKHNAFIYSDTVYNSDATDSSKSTDYYKDLSTGKVTTITSAQYEKYSNEEYDYRLTTFGK